MLFRRKKSYLIKVRHFEPFTISDKIAERKLKLKEEIKSQTENLEEIRGFCLDRNLSINVRFFLWGGGPGDVTPLEGRTKKDLDNLLKIVLDVLPEKMDNASKPEGLGLIRENQDHLVYEIRATKKIVSNILDEGMDIEISEFKG